MTMTTKKIREIMSDLEDVVKQVEEKHGIEVDFGNTRYSETEFKTPLTVTYFGQENKEDVLKDKFIKGATLKGVNVDYFGQEFKEGRKTLQVVGINTRASKNFIELKEVNSGVEYKCSLDALKSFTKV